MGRMSHRERLERLQAEKAAEEREKQEKKAKRAASPSKSTRSRSAPEPATRERIVWAVCNHMGDPVKTFPYPQKDEAEAEAKRLTEEKETRHYVSRQKVPMDS